MGVLIMKLEQQPEVPTGANILAPLHEFVITVIEYVRMKDHMGRDIVVPVRTEVWG